MEEMTITLLNLNNEQFEDINIYESYMDNKRKQILYQKTNFNAHLICQLPSIFKCCKCKRNNTIVVPATILSQPCLF